VPTALEFGLAKARLYQCLSEVLTLEVDFIFIAAALPWGFGGSQKYTVDLGRHGELAMPSQSLTHDPTLVKR